MESSKTLTLPDGRLMGYEEFGSPDGKPLLFLHGNPGSRLDLYYTYPERIGRTDLRIIAPDRPGIGLSGFQEGRSFLDYPADICALADHLGLQRFAALSVSTGSAYLAALAYAIPERLEAAGIVSGVCPFRIDSVTKGMAPRPYFWLAKNVPFLAGLYIKMMEAGVQDEKNVDKFIKQIKATVPEPDRQALSDPDAQSAMFKSVREALRQGSRGLIQDAALFEKPWGFELEKIRIPVQLWHGEADRNAPPAMGRFLARTLPDCRARFYPGEGHFSLLVKNGQEIHGELVP
jgi:pimeloyl-ACP methyl ester carboxylesterase